MPFYKALEYLLNTSNGRIRRKEWGEKHFLKRIIIGGEAHIQHMKLGYFTKEFISCGLYRPAEMDVVANDWEIVPLESYK